MKLDMEALQKIKLFEQVTKAHVKDCFEYKERLTFVVDEGQLWKALGKQNVNLIKLEKLLNRKVKIVEFRSDVKQFIVNLLHPLKVIDMTDGEDGVIIVKGPDAKTKGLMIGSRAQNLRATEDIVRKYFECKEIKVV